jgi:DnaJ-class molecular chaperone
MPIDYNCPDCNGWGRVKEEDAMVYCRTCEGRGHTHPIPKPYYYTPSVTWDQGEYNREMNVSHGTIGKESPKSAAKGKKKRSR